jgi:hypothetical protein
LPELLARSELLNGLCALNMVAGRDLNSKTPPETQWTFRPIRQTSNRKLILLASALCRAQVTPFERQCNTHFAIAL